MYAVIETGGKQYRVAQGDVVKVEKLDAGVKDSVEFTNVLLVSGEAGVKIGRPYVSGAKVTAKVLKHDRDKKILVFRYKPKKNVRVRKGHRQPFTEVQITGIEA